MAETFALSGINRILGLLLKFPLGNIRFWADYFNKKKSHDHLPVSEGQHIQNDLELLPVLVLCGD